MEIAYDDLPEEYKNSSIDLDNLSKDDLLSEKLYAFLFSVKDNFDRTQAETTCRQKAKEYKLVNEFNKNYKQYLIREVAKHKNTGGNLTKITDAPIILNCGQWIANDYGVQKNEMTSDFRAVTKVACPHPILPVELLTNMDTDIEKIKLAFYKNGQWSATICERVTAANTSKIVELSNRGIEVNSENSKNLVSYIADCVALNEDKLPRFKAVSRMGWIGDEFMPYDQNIRFDGERENRYLFDCVSQKGDYRKWVEYTKKLREKPLLRLQMAASFASPIIERVNTLPFVLHYWGGPLTTGSGKTVGLMVAASIWGRPSLGGLVRTMDSTQNAIMNIAGFLYSIPYFGDELQLIKNQWTNYDKLIMKVCEGADRGRMSYDKMLPTKVWKNAFLFTGEESIVRRDSGAGVYSRVIEVECKELVVENGNQVVNFINENYGLAGEVYINALKDESLLNQYEQTFKKIIDKDITNEKQAMAMACILLGDYLAEKHIYRSGTNLKIADVEQYLFSREEIDVASRAYEWVLDWVSENQIRFDEDNGVNRGEVWGKFKDNNKKVVYINRKVLSEHMSKMGIELSAVIGKWLDRELVENTTIQVRINGTKPRCIALVIDRGGESDEDEQLPLPKPAFVPTECELPEEFKE